MKRLLAVFAKSKVRIGEMILLGFLLAGFCWLTLGGSRNLGATFDEPAYLAAGHTHWHYGDHRFTVLNGPLPHLLHGWAISWQHPKFPAEQADLWAHSHLYRAGRELLYRQDNDQRSLLRAARVANSLFGAGLVLVCFFWGRALAGRLAGWVAGLLACGSTTLLAHSALATSDAAFTFFLTAGLFAFWSCWQRLTLVSALGFALSVTGALSSKITGPLLLLISGTLGWLYVFHPRPWPVGSSWQPTRRWKKLLVVVGLHALACLTAWGVVWAMHGFRYSAFHPERPPGVFSRSWEEVTPKTPVLAGAVQFVRDHRLLPEGYLWGLCGIYAESGKRSAWLRGEYTDTGWWYFFPVSFAIKSNPTEWLCLLAFLLLPCFLRRGQRGPPEGGVLAAWLPIFLLFAAYWLISLTNKVNIGHRHLLPVYPALFLSGGWLTALLWESLRTRRGKLALLLLPASQLGTALAAHPGYLTYFNFSIGGSAQGWRWLVDSSLDWGQGLPALQAWLDQNPPTEPVYLAYFGMDCLDCQQLPVKSLLSIPAQGVDILEIHLQPGLYVISATMLSGVYVDKFPGPWRPEYEELWRKIDDPVRQALRQNASGRFSFQREHWSLYQRGRFARLCAYLRQRGPDAQIDPSLLVFRLTSEDLQQAWAR